MCVTLITSTPLTFRINVRIGSLERERWGGVFFTCPGFFSNQAGKMTNLLRFPPDIDPQMKFTLIKIFPSHCKHIFSKVVKLICHSLSEASLVVYFYFFLLTQTCTYIYKQIDKIYSLHIKSGM